MHFTEEDYHWDLKHELLTLPNLKKSAVHSLYLATSETDESTTKTATRRSCRKQQLIQREILTEQDNVQIPEVKEFQHGNVKTPEKIPEVKQFQYDNVKIPEVKQFQYDNVKIPEVKRFQSTDGVIGLQKDNPSTYIPGIEKLTNIRGFQCSICSIAYPMKSDLETHLNQSHSKKNRFRCEFCGLQTVHKSELSFHEEAFHADELKLRRINSWNTESETTGKEIKSSTKKDASPHIKETAFGYMCKFCGRFSHHKLPIISHVVNVHLGVGNSTCAGCLTTFKHKARFIRHTSRCPRVLRLQRRTIDNFHSDDIDEATLTENDFSNSNYNKEKISLKLLNDNSVITKSDETPITENFSVAFDAVSTSEIFNSVKLELCEVLNEEVPIELQSIECKSCELFLPNVVKNCQVWECGNSGVGAHELLDKVNEKTKTEVIQSASSFYEVLNLKQEEDLHEYPEFASDPLCFEG